jgi:hypothetical protein
MGPLSSAQNSENLFRQQLLSLSQKGLNDDLLVSSKRFFGLHDTAPQQLVEQKTLKFLTEGRQWIKTPEDIELVKTLAKKIGLIQSDQKNPSELQVLINEICTSVPPKTVLQPEQKKEKEENQRETLSDDQAPTTSQEDSHPHEQPAKSNDQHIVPTEPGSKTPQASVEDLVIPASISTDTHAAPASPQTKSPNLSKVVSKALKQKEDHFSSTTKAAFAATGAIGTLASLYFLYNGSSPTPPAVDYGLIGKVILGAVGVATTVLVGRAAYNTLCPPQNELEKNENSENKQEGGVNGGEEQKKLEEQKQQQKLEEQRNLDKQQQNEEKKKLEEQNQKREQERQARIDQENAEKLKKAKLAQLELVKNQQLIAKEKAEKERIEKLEKEKLKIEAAKKEQEANLARERIEKEKSEKEKVEKERLKIEADKVKKEQEAKLEQERIKQEEQERAKELALKEAERIEAQQKLEREKIEEQQRELQKIEEERKPKGPIEIEEQKLGLQEVEEPYITKQQLELQKQQTIAQFEQEFDLLCQSQLQAEQWRLKNQQGFADCHLELLLKNFKKLEIDGIAISDEEVQKCIKKEYDSPNVYATILMLDRWLNVKKDECYDAETGKIVNGDRLGSILNSLEALEKTKEEYFLSRKEKLSDQKKDKAEAVLKTLQEAAGNFFVPVDYKLALLEFMAEKPKQEKLLDWYFILASNPKAIFDNQLLGSCRLDSGIFDSHSMTCLEALPLFFKKHFESLPNLSKEIKSAEDFRFNALYSNLKKMHYFLLNKLGGVNNSHIILDSMKIERQYYIKINNKDKLQRENFETETAKKYDATVQKENAFLREDEQRLKGFHSYEQYGIKIKNDWNLKQYFIEETDATIECSSIFLIKEQDGDSCKKESTIKVDVSGISNFLKNNEKFIMQFIQDYCKSISERKEALANSKSFQGIDDITNVLINNELMPDKGLDVMNLLEQRYIALIAVCKSFDEQIEKILKGIFDPEAVINNLEKSQIFESSQICEISTREIEDDDTDEEDETEKIKAQPQAESSVSSTIWSSFGSLLNVAYNVAFNTAVTAGAAVNAGLYIAWNKAIEMLYPDPIWVKEKFAKSVSNIFTKLRADEESFKCIKKLDDVNSFEGKDRELAKLVKNIFESEKLENLTLDNARNNHVNFIINLRAVLDSALFKEASKNHELVKVILEICRIRFEEGDFFSFFNKTMDEFGLKKGGPAILSDEDFNIIENTLKTNNDMGMRRLLVNLGCLQGHFNVYFDPHLNENIPYLLATLNFGDKKQRKLLRTGSPTKQFIGTAVLNPEFKGYLTWLKNNGKKHLYISLQNDKGKWIGQGDETGRNQAIKDAEYEFKGTFYAVVLAQDSRFYKQENAKGEPLGTQQADQFIKEFYNEMLVKANTGFYFPNGWKTEPNFQKSIDLLLHQVHEVFFNKKEDLTLQEKKDFIEIFYAYLSAFLIYWSNADNVNISCKDAMDRAGKSNSLLMQLLLIIGKRVADLSKKPVEQYTDMDRQKRKCQRIHQVLSHMGALWVKGQAILDSRRTRLMSAFALMCNKMTEIQSSKVKVIPINGKEPIAIFSERENELPPIMFPPEAEEMEVEMEEKNPQDKGNQETEKRLLAGLGGEVCQGVLLDEKSYDMYGNEIKENLLTYG